MKYEQIKPYIEQRLVSEQVHPENPDVRIFNYTQTCQFSRKWDEVTMQCRGLILNIKTGEVLARPFPKFFNFEEHVNQGKSLPDELPTICEKMDGSLGILYELNGVERIATRGSFTSNQAIWATKWWQQNVPPPPAGGKRMGTALFEIIYPENRIVVNYDFAGLVYLATIDIPTGNLIDDMWLQPIRHPKRIPNNDLAALTKLEQPNSEGFVVFYPKANLRLKIKLAEYVRLHRLVTGVSVKAIWDLMRTGQSFDDLLEKVPDEFFAWVKRVQAGLQQRYDYIEQQADKDWVELRKSLSDGATRKEWALAIKDQTYPQILFARMDGKAYEPMIWRMIKPKGDQSFKSDIDA